MKKEKEKTPSLKNTDEELDRLIELIEVTPVEKLGAIELWCDNTCTRLCIGVTIPSCHRLDWYNFEFDSMQSGLIGQLWASLQGLIGTFNQMEFVSEKSQSSAKLKKV